MPYDLFISYSRRDNQKGRIAQLVERIKADFLSFADRELVSFFDRDEIHGMQDWRQRILQGLRESRLLLACISPTYLQSEYCEWEFVEYLKYEIGHLHGFNGVAPIYFVQVTGWDNKDFDQKCAAWIAELRRRQHFDLRPWHDQSEEALHEAAVQDRMGKLNRQIVQTITRGERAEKSLGNVDAHNPHFIGRTANLRLLRDNFVKPGHIGVVTAVNGVGGLGKTALAIEYAHAFADEYGGGRWQVRCAGKDDLRLALAELATPIGFEFTDDEKKNADLQFDRTRRELQKLADSRAPHRCLLLLDNVDRPGLLDPAQVARLNGGDWLHVLATTRLGENELHGAHRDRSFLAVDELPADDALALIESYQPDARFRSEAERDAAREIVRLLGCFTLAVESAAVYLGQFANDVTCAAFLARLKKEGLEGLDTAASQSNEGVLHGENRLGATLQPTLERLGAAEKLALEFAALLPPDQVALPWLRALVAKTFPEMERNAEPGYPDPWKNVLRRLFSLRLLQATDAVDADGQPREVRVHRLVQQLMLRDCPATVNARWQQAVEELIHKRDAVLEKTNNWVEARWELEPLSGLAELWTSTQNPSAGWLLNQVGVRLGITGDWLRAEDFNRQALAFDEAMLGPDHIVISTRLLNLGRSLTEINLTTEAEPVLRRAVEIAEGHFGADNPAMLSALSQLCNWLRATGQIEKAEVLCRRAIKIAIESFGFNHPETASMLSNLAHVLGELGRLKEAEQCARQVLAIDERINGVNHPSFAHSLNLLSNLLYGMRRFDEAELLLRKALAIYAQSFDPNHPDVAICLNNLSMCLCETDRVRESEGFLRRALTIDETHFGGLHPNIAIRLSNLALVLQDTNRAEEAEPFMRRALAITEHNHGPTDLRVALPLNNLAQLFKATNRLAEAEPLSQRALELLLNHSRSTGNQHPHLQAGINNHTRLLQAMGRTNKQILASLRHLAPEFFPK